MFDVTCFAGINQYHTLRVEGKCNPGQLSSVQIRCVDFEIQANRKDTESDDHEQTGGASRGSKEEGEGDLGISEDDFKKNTRAIFYPCMTYLASTHLAWEPEANHERISPLSMAFLQAGRKDLAELKHYSIDPNADIVCMIIDVITDKRNLHFVKDHSEAKEAATIQKNTLQTLTAEAKDDRYTAVPFPDIAELTGKLGARRVKDAVSVADVTSYIAPLVETCAEHDKELHLFLTGCNTISTVPALKCSVPASAQERVWVLCTSAQWPGDVAPFLWHLYGSTARRGDLDEFRRQTRNMLGEYTEHFNRQRIRGNMPEGAMKDSLANGVHLDNLARVIVLPSGHAQMALL